MMLRLSPWVTAMKQSASSAPARRSRSASVPSPTTKLPRKLSPNTPREAERPKAPGLLSTMVTSCPSSSSSCARREPTRPQPTMRIFTGTLLYGPPAAGPVLGGLLRWARSALSIHLHGRHVPRPRHLDHRVLPHPAARRPGQRGYRGGHRVRDDRLRFVGGLATP